MYDHFLRLASGFFCVNRRVSSKTLLMKSMTVK